MLNNRIKSTNVNAGRPALQRAREARPREGSRRAAAFLPTRERHRRRWRPRSPPIGSARPSPCCLVSRSWLEAR